MKLNSTRSIGGFTIIEMLVVIAIIGILAAIAAPSWIALLARQRVNAAQAEALNVVREAQANAKREKRVWQACFREFNDTDGKMRTQWSVQPASGDGSCNLVASGSWTNLIGADADVIAIDTTNTNTNLPQAPNGYYRIQFQYKGLLGDGQQTPTKITFGIRQVQGSQGVTDGTKRCVLVQTILGAISTNKDRECTQ